MTLKVLGVNTVNAVALALVNYGSIRHRSVTMTVPDTLVPGLHWWPRDRTPGYCEVEMAGLEMTMGGGVAASRRPVNTVAGYCVIGCYRCSAAHGNRRRPIVWRGRADQRWHLGPQRWIAIFCETGKGRH